MAKYIAVRDTLIAHENRIVREGEEFETTFPPTMHLCDNLIEVKPEVDKKGKVQPTQGCAEE